LPEKSQAQFVRLSPKSKQYNPSCWSWRRL